MQRKYFGTDGIRGRSNADVIAPEAMIKLARATCIACGFLGSKTTVVIGKDTRLSGYMLETALTSGFISMGTDVILTGPLPTPAISMAVKSLRADLGIMISASHNPYYDNGVKLFSSSGHKISQELETKIELLMDTDLSSYVADYDHLGKALKLEDIKGRYIEHLKGCFPGLKLDGIKAVIDCAAGAAYDVAPRILRELGVEVVLFAASPNGFNINEECGVTAPGKAARKVVETGADLGITLDGDADRMLIIDEKGNVINGDGIIAALAEDFVRKGLLKNNGVVATVLSNSGLENYLKSLNIKLTRTPVGDKHVARAMLEGGYSLGGEEAGHIIVGENQATGDGLKAALSVLALYKESGKVPISRLLNKFVPVPQFSRNISYDGTYYDDSAALSAGKIEDITQRYGLKYGSDLRIVIRKSGTESVIRITVESPQEEEARKALAEIAEEIEVEVGANLC